MNCPYCQSANIYLRKAKTTLGYACYQCKACFKYYNERTGTPFGFLQYPTDIVLLAVFYYYRYKNSLVDVTEHLTLRGFSISHETIRLWSQEIGTEIGLKFRYRRWGQCGKNWHMDITYLPVEGRWSYLYRAIDEENNLIDVYLSDTPDKAAAEVFFKQCEHATGILPHKMITDREKAFPGAIKRAFGEKVKHCDVRYLNNRIEQDHRHIKSRVRAMKGFKSSWCAMIFCHVFEEIKYFFRTPNKSLAQHRGIIASKFKGLLNLMGATA